MQRSNARRVRDALKCRLVNVGDVDNDIEWRHYRHVMTEVTSASDVRIVSNLLNVENRAAQILAINYDRYVIFFWTQNNQLIFRLIL